MPTRRLRIQHASFQRTDPRAQQAEDVEALFAAGGDFIGLTEVGYRENPHVQPLLRHAARAHGYRLYLPAGYGEGVGVRANLGRVAGKGVTRTFVDGRAGQFPDRNARYLTVDIPDVGRVTHLVFHANPNDADPARHAQNLLINAGVAQVAQRKGRGHRIVFASADTNVDDARDNGPRSSTRPLREAGLVSCWDESREWPDTHGTRTIDVVWRYDRDSRVTLAGARRLPRRNSDHRPVMAAYDVKLLR